MIPELNQIKTPYGKGVFRIRDTMNKRFNGLGKIDIFIPDEMKQLENQIRKIPSGNFIVLD